MQTQRVNGFAAPPLEARFSSDPGEGPALEAARCLARALRRPSDGPLDEDRTARFLGLVLKFRDLPEELDGLCLGEDLIVLSTRISRPRRRFVFGHEVTHALVRRGRLVCQAEEELLADRLGHEFALPTPALIARLASGPALIRRLYGVDEFTLWSQLSAISRLPRFVRTRDGTVICRRCGQRPHGECLCRSFRWNPSLPLPQARWPGPEGPTRSSLASLTH